MAHLRSFSGNVPLDPGSVSLLGVPLRHGDKNRFLFPTERDFPPESRTHVGDKLVSRQLLPHIVSALSLETQEDGISVD